MAKIVFDCGRDNAKKVTDFLNSYFGNLSVMSGNTDIYVIEYNSSFYKATGYFGYNKAERDKVVKGAEAVFQSIPPFMTFPKEVRDKMIEYSSSKSPIPFLIDECIAEGGGGFSWCDTEEGSDFWNKVIEDKNFELFNKQFKTENYESKLCNENSSLRGDSDRNTGSIRSRFNKARVTGLSLSYKEISGRG